MSADELAITILTGRRPDYLKETIRSFLEHAQVVAFRAHVTLMVNGRDDQTESFVRELPWVDDLRILPGPEVVPIGPAISTLHGAAVASGRRHWLHLEDDWRCVGSGWLRSATSVLAKHRKVGQVRLRRASERVLGYHMVTRKRIDWKAKSSGYRVGHAHYTFNPSLVRLSDVASVFPCDGEPQAMRKYVRTKLDVAQLTPGAFRHLGEDSLRESLGRAF